MRLSALLILLSALGASACGAGGARLTASAGDYANYRAVRVAPSVPSRLRAAWYYLEHCPQGVFRLEVQEWFDRVEPLFYEASADSPQGMEAYLDALPRGPHAASAEQRRDAFRATAKIGERLAAVAAAFERRLAAAAQSREDVLTAYASWVRRLVELDTWGRPLEEASDELKKAWSAGSTPRCEPNRCTKLLEIPYELEVGGKPEPFECMIEISLTLSAGKVVGAVIAGPDLFARLSEAHDAEPVSRDQESREHAVGFSTTFTPGAIERKLPRARCDREAAPPAVMTRECDGLRLDIFPKMTMDDDDRVVIRGPARL